MAKIIYEVYQNQNEHNAAYGKWYGRVKYLESLNTRKLSNHIAEHGSIYTPDIPTHRSDPHPEWQCTGDVRHADHHPSQK